MSSVPKIKLQASTADYVPNPHPNGETPFEEFWAVRSSVLAAANRHGKTGPEGGPNDNDFWLVEDQLSDERYQRLEVKSPEAFSAGLIHSLAAALREHPGWGLSIGGYDNGHLVLFAERLLLIGDQFDGCATIADVAASLQRGVKSFHERKHGSLEHQMKLIKHRLKDAMAVARENGFAYLATFDHYQLHDYEAVWMLQTTHNDELYMDTDQGTAHPRAVDSDGTIHEPYCRDFWPFTDVKPDFWLAVYLNSQRNLREFRYLDEEQAEVAIARTAAAIGAHELSAVLARLPQDAEQCRPPKRPN